MVATTENDIDNEEIITFNDVKMHLSEVNGSCFNQVTFCSGSFLQISEETKMLVLRNVAKLFLELVDGTRNACLEQDVMNEDGE